MSAAGMFKITGRYKELLIGAGGENIAPVPIEDELKKLCAAISNVMIVGDKMPYNCALVTLKCVGATGELPGGSELDGAAASLVDGVSTVEQASASSAFTDLILAAIKATNANPAACPMNAAKVQKFTILPRDFSVTTDEITPTFKLKRSFVHGKYKAAIDQMYAEKGPYVPCGSAVVVPSEEPPVGESAALLGEEGVPSGVSKRNR